MPTPHLRRKRPFSLPRAIGRLPRPFSLVLLFLLILLFFSLALNAIQWGSQRRRNTVVAVPDGDSLDLADGRRVRLLGIDAPEKGECLGEEARQALSSLALGRHVRLKETLKDSYGRILAVAIKEDLKTRISSIGRRFFSTSDVNVFCTDPLLNRAMLRLGLARYTFSLGPQSQYAVSLKAEAEESKKEKRGIWSEQCRSSKPRPGLQAGSLEAKTCDIKGNVRAGQKRYYLPKCENYDQVIVDTSFGDRWFCSENEATSAGFTESSTCLSR